MRSSGLGLERGLSISEHWLLMSRFLEPCGDSSYRGSGALFGPPRTLHACDPLTYLRQTFTQYNKLIKNPKNFKVIFYYIESLKTVWVT